MKKLIIPAIAIASIALTNCGKNYDPVTVGSGTYTIANVMSSLAVQPKTVTIDATTGGSFRGTSGTRYVFEPNSFMNSSGIVVSGNVQVTVAEYLKKGDMLFSNVLPISNGEPLLSGGEIFVEAKKDGETLQMAPGKAFRANMPMAGTDPTGMALFTGTRDNGGAVNWNFDTGVVLNSLFTTGDTIGISSIKFQYLNADRFMTAPNFQTFKITVNAGGKKFSNDSITINTFYDEYNGVWPLGLDNIQGTPDHVYTENNVPNIPVHFVVFAIIKGNLYGGILGATPVTGGNYTVTLTQTTPVAFKTLVLAL